MPSKVLNSVKTLGIYIPMSLRTVMIYSRCKVIRRICKVLWPALFYRLSGTPFCSKFALTFSMLVFTHMDDITEI